MPKKPFFKPNEKTITLVLKKDSQTNENRLYYRDTNLEYNTDEQNASKHVSLKDSKIVSSNSNNNDNNEDIGGGGIDPEILAALEEADRDLPGTRIKHDDENNDEVDDDDNDFKGDSELEDDFMALANPADPPSATLCKKVENWQFGGVSNSTTTTNKKDLQMGDDRKQNAGKLSNDNLQLVDNKKQLNDDEDDDEFEIDSDVEEEEDILDISELRIKPGIECVMSRRALRAMQKRDNADHEIQLTNIRSEAELNAQFTAEEQRERLALQQEYRRELSNMFTDMLNREDPETRSGFDRQSNAALSSIASNQSYMSSMANDQRIWRKERPTLKEIDEELDEDRKNPTKPSEEFTYETEYSESKMDATLDELMERRERISDDVVSRHSRAPSTMKSHSSQIRASKMKNVMVVNLPLGVDIKSSKNSKQKRRARERSEIRKMEALDEQAGNAESGDDSRMEMQHDCDECSSENEEQTGKFQAPRRAANETSEQRRARKHLVKDQKRLRRLEKKQTKQDFKSVEHSMKRSSQQFVS